MRDFYEHQLSIAGNGNCSDSVWTIVLVLKFQTLSGKCEANGFVRRCLTIACRCQNTRHCLVFAGRMSVAAIEFAVVGKILLTNSAYAGLARRSLANVGTRLLLSGRDFGGDDFDEVGGAETPELA
jgi:hypothetical protein